MDVVEILLKAGADPTAQNLKGQQALDTGEWLPSSGPLAGSDFVNEIG